MIGTILVQRCTNGRIFYMLDAGRYGKWFQTLAELREYAKYNGIQLNQKMREV